jgi:FAD/FMN-containing dehydrogenase
MDRRGSLSRRELLAAGGALAVSSLLPVGRAGAQASPAVRALAGDVKGPVLTPRTSASLVFNERYASIRPLAVVQATSVADVQACVRWAAREGVRVTARSGGHSYAGYSTARDGLVVDLRRLDRVSLSNGTVTAGPGVHLMDLYSALARRGATVPGGSCPTVGLGGLALGGGMGLAGRRFGLTCDNVTALEIVTADGRVRRCDARDERELFWACRGAGNGNFGIVTGLQLRAHRVTSAAWFALSWPAEQGDEALDAWQRLAPHAPRALTSILTIADGRVSAAGQWFGTEASLRRVLAPLTRVDGASLRTGTAGYLALMQRWAGCAGDTTAQCTTFSPTPFDAASAYVSEPLPASARRTAIALTEGGEGTLLLDAYGGAINAVDVDATAFVHRDELFCIQFYSGSSDADWLARARRALAAHTAGAYQNYMDPQLEDWGSEYYGPHLPRLREIKRMVDPGRMFRFRQAV